MEAVGIMKGSLIVTFGGRFRLDGGCGGVTSVWSVVTPSLSIKNNKDKKEKKRASLWHSTRDAPSEEFAVSPEEEEKEEEIYRER